jgi:hypothetical protein
MLLVRRVLSPRALPWVLSCARRGWAVRRIGAAALLRGTLGTRWRAAVRHARHAVARCCAARSARGGALVFGTLGTRWRAGVRHARHAVARCCAARSARGGALVCGTGVVVTPRCRHVARWCAARGMPHGVSDSLALLRYIRRVARWCARWPACPAGAVTARSHSSCQLALRQLALRWIPQCLVAGAAAALWVSLPHEHSNA